jgi:hypothetical protein
MFLIILRQKMGINDEMLNDQIGTSVRIGHELPKNDVHSRFSQDINKAWIPTWRTN